MKLHGFRPLLCLQSCERIPDQRQRPRDPLKRSYVTSCVASSFFHLFANKISSACSRRKIEISGRMAGEITSTDRVRTSSMKPMTVGDLAAVGGRDRRTSFCRTEILTSKTPLFVSTSGLLRHERALRSITGMPMKFRPAVY